MFGSTTIDMVIGLAFIYLLLGLITSVVVELLASMLDLRAKYLRLGLRTLLKDDVLVEQLYAHPMIESLILGYRFPPYVPARAFALAILGLVRGADEGEFVTFAHLREALYTLPVDGASGSLRRVLLTMADDAGEDLDRLRHNIEFWYISTMDRVSGLYKQRVQWMIVIVALTITVAANLDTGAIAKYLSISPFLHDALIGRTISRASDPQSRYMPTPSPYPSPSLSITPAPAAYASVTPLPSPVPTRTLPYSTPEIELSEDGTPTLNRGTEELGLPFGWFQTSQTWTPGRLFASILGWLFTAFCATICALFWFDVLNKFILVRSAVKPREDELHTLVGPKPPSSGDGGYGTAP